MQEQKIPEKKPGTPTETPHTDKQGGHDTGKKGGESMPGKTGTGNGGDLGRTGGDVGKTGEVGKQGR